LCGFALSPGGGHEAVVESKAFTLDLRVNIVEGFSY
jgi:hypothetical protein